MSTYPVERDHQHRTVPRLRIIRSFTNCCGYSCDPRSHGNIVVIDTCRCGEIRHTNVNQRYRETAGWSNRRGIRP
jgi:hypothetical protein